MPMREIKLEEVPTLFGFDNIPDQLTMFDRNFTTVLLYMSICLGNCIIEKDNLAKMFSSIAFIYDDKNPPCHLTISGKLVFCRDVCNPPPPNMIVYKVI